MKKYTCSFSFTIEVEAENSWEAMCKGSEWVSENLPQGLTWYQETPEETN